MDDMQALERFVVRCRYVQEHSLAADIAQLRENAKYEFKLMVTVQRESGEESVAFAPTTLLPPEQVESAAARVRPLFLKKDGIKYERVLPFLKGRVSKASDKSAVQAQLESFRASDPDFSSVNSSVPWAGAAISNRQISGGWLYGHLLHEDASRRSYVEPLHLEEAYHAAMVTVCQQMLAAVTTLHLVEQLAVREAIILPDDVFTTQVTVEPGEWTRPGTVVVAATNNDPDRAMELPSFEGFRDGQLPPGWTGISESLGFLAPGGDSDDVD